MTRYKVIIEDQLLDEIRGSEERLPAGFRVLETLGPAGYSTSYVQVEDDGAPADLEGCLVEPTFERRYATGETVIVGRLVMERPT